MSRRESACSKQSVVVWQREMRLSEAAIIFIAAITSHAPSAAIYLNILHIYISLSLD